MEGLRQIQKITQVIFGILRGIVLGLAVMSIAGSRFEIAFGLLTALLLSVSFLAGFSPVNDYEVGCKPNLTRRKLGVSILRTLIVAAAGVLAAVFTTASVHSMLLGLRLGVAAGAVNALVGTFSSSIEWWIENLPERRLGVIGLGLIIAGMMFQSLQYWVVVWNIPVH